jgi:DNA-binding NarL/FixJ family response regulator
VIRVLLVEDHASFRQALAFLLDREPDIVVVGQAGSLAQARQMLEAVDVTIMDLALPDGPGLELVRELRAVSPLGAVLVLTANLDRREHARAIESGASGVLHKSAEIDDVLRAVRRIAAGELALSREEIMELWGLASQPRLDSPARPAPRQLTVRELEVLQALADGLSDKEIAQRLNLSPQTVRNHVVNILGKLGAHSRLQALVFAVRYGLVTVS